MGDCKAAHNGSVLEKCEGLLDLFTDGLLGGRVNLQMDDARGPRRRKPKHVCKVHIQCQENSILLNRIGSDVFIWLTGEPNV